MITSQSTARELLGGFTSALVLVAVYGSYGVVALAPLGPAYAATGFLMGALSAALANVVSAAVGDRGPLLSGPSAALSLLVPPLLGALFALPAVRGTGAAPDPVIVLALLGLGVAVAGLLQVLVGALRLGIVVRYVPYPVHAGFMTSVAVLMVLAMVPHALGLPEATGAVEWAAMRPLALVVTAVSLVLSLVTLPVPGLGRIPTLMVAVVGGSLVHHALAAWAGPQAVGPVLGPLPMAWPTWAAVERLADPGVWSTAAGAAVPLLQFAGALALTGSLQSLLAASAVDTLTGSRRDGDVMLRGQGAAKLLGGLLVLLPSAGGLSHASVNLRCGGQGTLSRVAHGLSLVVLLTAGAGLIRHLPMAAIAGTFVAAAWWLVDGWTRRAVADAARSLLSVRPLPPGLAAPLAVVGVVTAVSVFVSLIAGVATGIAAAVLLFVRDHMRPPVRRVTTGAQRGSRKLRGAAEAARLRERAHRIVTVELDGALFFGTADAAVRAIEAAARDADHLIVDLHRVRDIDASGARLLVQAVTELTGDRRRLSLAGVDADDARGRAIREMDLRGVLPPAVLHADADRALEAAEDRLLADAAPTAVASPAEPHCPLPLSATRLGDGLDDGDLALLERYLVSCRHAEGDAVFRRGDAGSALYVLRSGQVAIVLPADIGGLPAQRLVSYAPGAVFGEIGVLRGIPRTADAVCERPSELARIDAPALEALAAVHPDLHARLLRNLALQLADRLAALTLEVQALDDRTPPRAAGRPPTTRIA